MTHYDRYMFQQRNIWPGLCQNDVSKFFNSDLLLVRRSSASLWASAKFTAESEGVLVRSTMPAAPHRGRLRLGPPGRPTQATPASETDEAVPPSESLNPPPPPPPRRPHLDPGAPPPVLVICLKCSDSEWRS